MACAFIAAAAAAAFTLSGERCAMVSGTGVLSINLDRLAPGRAEKFCYVDRAGSKIRFVLARGSDRKVRSVFDACSQCSSYRKGYTISRGDLVCRVCGNRYPVDRIMTGKASCVPISLAHRDQGGTVKIKVADILVARALF